MIAASRQWLKDFTPWLSLVVVLTCALCSFGSPVRATTGSAFNAFTRDVAIGSRAVRPEKHRRETAAPSGGAGQTLAPAASAVALVPPSAARDAAVAEPAASLLPQVSAGPLGARAPPQS